jgi:phosphoribosylformimino-5-aminoimidazole carboxamide ribotide isomerase
MRAGRCVRLCKGRAQDMTDYGNPLAMALRWQRQGAAWLHLVDLDGAFTGRAANLAYAQQIAALADIPVQLGGGIRTLADIADRLEKRGIARVILGTVALENPSLVIQACRAYPGRVICGVDAVGGRVAVRGWVTPSETSAEELALRLRDAGVETIIYTDISRDGTRTGPNLAETAALAQSTGLQVIASGGVRGKADIRALRETGCTGVICGKALYEGDLTLAQALAAAKGEDA